MPDHSSEAQVRQELDSLASDLPEIRKTLTERGKRYGEFKTHALIAQGLQEVMRTYPGWNLLAKDQRQALTVIADKIARILNGDPTYADNWVDIAGYATLVADRLKKDHPQP